MKATETEKDTPRLVGWDAAHAALRATAITLVLAKKITNERPDAVVKPGSKDKGENRSQSRSRRKSENKQDKVSVRKD